MAAPPTYPSVLPTHLQDLYKLCGYWGHSNIVEGINKAKKHIEECGNTKTLIDLNIVSDPFIAASHKDIQRFQNPCLDYFTDIFNLSSQRHFPNINLTFAALNMIYLIPTPAPNDIRYKVCKMLTCLLSSVSGDFFIHGSKLRKAYMFLLTLHHISQGTELVKVVETAIIDSIRHLVQTHIKPPPIPCFNTAELTAKFSTQMIVRNAITIASCAPHIKCDNIHDSDMVCIIRTLCDVLEKRNFCIETICICASNIIGLLQSRFNFFKSAAFESLLQSDIHIILLSMAIHSHNDLNFRYSVLLLTVWKRFARIYVQGLHEVLTKGLAHSLSSPSEVQVRNSCLIYQGLTAEPQFFVDMYMNYDCGQIGESNNVFENTMNLLVKHSYPDDPNQKVALMTLNKILKSLWTYFNKFESRPDSTEKILEAKRQKNVFEQGLELFKKSPKKGLQYFIDNGFTDQENAAEFLYKTTQLDEAGVGEIIGTLNNGEILRKYVAMFDFKCQGFEVAFREFLSRFQIPGEGQMIDRIMEQFGAKYYADNPGVFTCADTVYAMSYSTLMLHTSAHHPNITTRMTLEEFIINNKGLDGGKDLPREFLTDLYKGIVAKRIFLSSQDTSSSLLTREQRIDLYREKCNQAIEDARRHITESKAGTYHRTESSAIISPMFQTIWRPLLAVYTTSFHAANDEKTIKYCLSGFTFCIHISSHCYIEDALTTFIDSFTKFTRLRSIAGNVIQEKNIECLQSFVDCVISDRYFMKGMWGVILDQISALDATKLLSVPEIFFNESNNLDRESIIEFVKAMCETSQSELDEDPPRMYTLLKLIDVAYFNMERPKIIWKEIWEIIGEYIITISQLPNIAIAQAAVDVLRQLTKKFIEKPEMNEFHFQQHFLRPFFEIYMLQPSPVVKSLILDCATQIVTDLSNSLQSGWDVIFQILSASIVDNQNRGFLLLKLIIDNHLEACRAHLVHLITVLGKYVMIHGKDDKLQKRTLDQFEKVAKVLKKEDSDVWICLFESLAKCSCNEHITIRQQANSVFIKILEKYELTEEIYKIVINDIVPKFFFSRDSSTEIAECWNILLSNFVVLPYFASCKKEMLQLLHTCCENNNSYFVNFTSQVFEKYISENFHSFTDEEIDLMDEHFEELAKLRKMEVMSMLIKMMSTFKSNSKLKTKVVKLLMKVTPPIDGFYFLARKFILQLFLKSKKDRPFKAMFEKTIKETESIQDDPEVEELMNIILVEIKDFDQERITTLFGTEDFSSKHPTAPKRSELFNIINK